MSDRYHLGELCNMIKGVSPTLKTEPGPYPLVVTAAYRRTASTWQIEGPAVCIPLISSTGHGDAALHRVHYQEGKFALANLLVALLPKNSAICDAKYLYHLLSTKKDTLLVPLMLGTANVSLKEKDIAGVVVSLPPLAEQRRLVDRIDALAGKIREAKSLREHADQESEYLAHAVINSLQAALSGVNEIGKLLTYLEGHDSGWSPQCSEVPAANGDWGVLKTTCVQWEGFDSSKNKALLPGMTPRPEIVVNSGDVLITRAGPVNRVGIACVVRESPPKLMLSDKIVRLRPKAILLPEFLAIYLATPDAQEYFRQGKTGLAESQVNISRGKLLNLPIRVPKLVQQKQYVDHMEKIWVAIAQLKSRQCNLVRQLDALLPSILDRAFNGEL